MRKITYSSIALAATLVLAFSSLAMSAPRSERTRKYITVSGRVLSINEKAQQLLIDDRSSNKLYLVNVAEGATFRITFGINMHLAEAGFRDVRKGNRVSMECARSDGQHFAQLEDGRRAVVLSVTR